MSLLLPGETTFCAGLKEQNERKKKSHDRGKEIKPFLIQPIMISVI